MILFYSDYCPHCRTILEEMKRRNVQDRVKLASIDKMKALKYPLPHFVTSVPTLYVPSTKEILTGKNVFDYFFLPGRGILLQAGPSPPSTITTPKAAPTTSNVVSDAIHTGEPMPFSLGGGLSEGFGMIEQESQELNPFTDYKWGMIQEESSVTEIKQELSMATEETRQKKEGLDLDGFKASRDAELGKIFNGPTPAIMPR
jgi:hypothetical protein